MKVPNCENKELKNIIIINEKLLKKDPEDYAMQLSYYQALYRKRILKIKKENKKKMEKLTDSQYKNYCKKLATDLDLKSKKQSDYKETLKSICNSLLSFDSKLRVYLMEKDYPERYLSNYLYKDIMVHIPK